MVTIRPATANEATAVAACVRAAFQPYVERLGRLPAPMREDYARVIAKETVVVAVDGESLVGVLVVRVTETGLLVETVAVMPERQGRGVGRRLLEAAEAEARRVGVATVCLYTHQTMIEARALYHRLGYREFARRTEDGYARVYLRKRIAGPD